MNNNDSVIIEKLERLERHVAGLRYLLVAALVLLCAIAFGVPDVLVGIAAVLSLLGFFVGVPLWLIAIHHRTSAEEEDEDGWEDLDTDGLSAFIRGTESKQ